MTRASRSRTTPLVRPRGRAGPKWQEWPESLRNVRSGAVTGEFAVREEAVLFHSWLQFLLDRQWPRCSAMPSRRA